MCLHRTSQTTERTQKASMVRRRMAGRGGQGAKRQDEQLILLCMACIQNRLA